MISPQVIKEHGTWFHGVLHLPVNVCRTCGESDDPEGYWAEDKDGDRICLACLPMAVLDRVEAALARAFKAATTPQDELHYFNGLTIVILARKDAEEHVDVRDLEEAERLKKARAA